VADLVTHGCVALLWKGLGDRARAATFVAGTCLPDYLGHAPPMLLARLRWNLPAIPEWLVYVWAPLHTPAGVAVGSYLVAHLFPEAERAATLRALLGGGLLHIAVDLLQSHFGVGYLLFFPFSLWDFELGWIGSEATVFLAPLLVVATWVVWKRAGQAVSHPAA
jgi:hypothetical protein